MFGCNKMSMSFNEHFLLTASIKNKLQIGVTVHKHNLNLFLQLYRSGSCVPINASYLIERAVKMSKEIKKIHLDVVYNVCSCDV